MSELETAAQEECALLGVKMTVVSAENNSDVQLQSISMFVEQGCDAIIVNLVESSLADDVITLAAGTPVVFVNRIPDLELVRGESCFVGSDEMESGRLQGEFLSDYFKERDQTNIDVVMLKGQSGVRNTELRTEMVKLTLMENGITANYIWSRLIGSEKKLSMKWKTSCLKEDHLIVSFVTTMKWHWESSMLC